MARIEINGLYIIDDKFFVDFPNERYMQNKGEARPHYYAIQDNDGVYWMIPLSSKVEKYRQKIAATEKAKGAGSCFLYYIAPISGKERAILICDMFPVSEKYILRPYTIDGQPYIVRNSTIQKSIRRKAMKYLNLVQRGILKSPLDILETKRKLIEK